MNSSFPDYAKPPVIELVLGVQFDQIPGFTAGHAGWFWKDHLGVEWKPSDAPLLDKQLETFGKEPVPSLGFQIQQAPAGTRLMIQNETSNRLVQVQNSRFHYNWRKADDTYPHYEPVLAEFLRHFTAFRAFVKDTAKLGAIEPNQWELTYIDAMPSGDLWKTPADWPTIFPGLFTPEQELQALSTELMSAERVYEITPRRGRLHISANMAFVGGRAQPVLLVTTTARGPIEQDSDDALKAALDLGHDASVEAFTKMTSAAAKRHWGQLP